MLSRMDLNDAFDSEFEVPLITRVETIGFVLKVSWAKQEKGWNVGKSPSW